MPKKKSEPRSTPGWMTTFGDMNSLLLTFFVVMLSTAEIEGYEIQLILSAFNGNIGMNEGGDTFSKGKLAEMGMTVESLPAREVGRKMSKSVKEAISLFKPEIRSKKVKIIETQKGIKIVLVDDFYFERGSAEIKPEMIPLLRKVAYLLSKIRGDYRIDVVGHTDQVPIKPGSKTSEKYPTNWELSAARACAVVRFLQDFGINPKIMKASGKGEYFPVDTSNTPEGRAYNRRTEIIIYRPGGK